MEDINVVVVELNDDDRSILAKLAVSRYLGEYCKYCDKQITTMEEMKTVVFAGHHAKGRIAHKDCWKKNNPE